MCPIARVGLSPFGQTETQFMIPLQRKTLKGAVLQQVMTRGKAVFHLVRKQDRTDFCDSSFQFENEH